MSNTIVSELRDDDAVERERAAFLARHPEILAAMPTWADSVEVDLNPEWVRKGAEALVIFKRRYSDGAEVCQMADFAGGEVTSTPNDGPEVVLPDRDARLEDALETVRDIKARLSGVPFTVAHLGISVSDAFDIAPRIVSLLEEAGYVGVEPWEFLEVFAKLEHVRDVALVAELTT